MSASNESEVKAGWDLYRRGDNAGAERCCQKVLARVPAHGGALGLLGLLRLGTGRANEAAAMLTQALNSKPRDAMLLGALGLAHLMRGNAVEAEQALRAALKWGNRDDAMLHMRLGMALGAQGRTADAIMELRRAHAMAPSNTDIALNLANAVAESGHAAEAEKLLLDVLAQAPEHADARFNLGTLYSQTGRQDEAAKAFRMLLLRYPGQAELHNSLGIVLERQLQWEPAEQAYRKALEIDGGHVPALNNLGNVLRARGRIEEAAECYSRAMQFAPAHPDGYLNMGALRAAQSRFDEANALFRKAISVDSRCIEAAINLGELLRQSGELHEAMEAFRKALAVDPDHATALNNMGGVLRMLGRQGEAAACFLKAIRSAPGNVDGYLNLGVLRAQEGAYDEACSLLKQAVKADETSRPARLKLAEALKISGRLEESRDAYRQLLSIMPGNPAASAGLAHVCQHLCAWEGIDALWNEARNAISRGENAGITPFSALSIPTTPWEQLTCARTWASAEFGWIDEKHRVLARGDAIPPVKCTGAPLKVGYLSWDYHEHATAYLMAEVFELHDRQRFHVTAYSFGPDDGSAIRQRIRQASDGFVDIAKLSNVDAAQRIADDHIDILIDLKGYTLGARTSILAHRPAPVQVNWLGFPGTMGTRCIDWILADHFIIPEGAEKNYEERVYRLPDCYQPNDRRREVAVAPTRAQCGLPQEGFVFCCFNQSYKILPEMYSTWMRILNRVPGSVLWLLETTPQAMRNLKLNAVARGVAAERLIFAPRRSLASHLARYQVADLALDTFPYTSHTTASDALWAGCPLIALTGDTFAARVSGSVLNAARLPELVTNTMDEFEDLSVRIALDPERRATFRRHLKEGRMTFPLFDAPKFVANIEKAYYVMCS